MIHKLEELIINTTPASNNIIEGGFLIRIYNTRNICTINKIGVYDNDVKQVVNSIELKLRKIGVSPCYRVVQDIGNDFDRELIANKYKIIERGEVIGIEIANMEKELFRFANLYEQGIIFEEGISREWLGDFMQLKKMQGRYRDIFVNNIENTFEDFMTFALIEEDRMIGMAYTNIFENLMIINDIYINERYRNLDYGKKMIKAILTKGLQKGCDYVFCDVSESQDVAYKMFKKIGFGAIYRYYYRGKDI